MSEPYWKNKTVVVSGGTGFIGSHFVEELQLLGANVICLHYSQLNESLKFKRVRYVRVDLANYDKLKASCDTITSNIDTFIHCAALDGNTQFKTEHSAEILDSNNRFVSNVLKVCSEFKIPNIALLSSAEVYAPSIPTPILEEYDYRKYPSFISNGYVLSKIFSEILANFYSKQDVMRIYALRPTNVYGPRDNFETTANRVIPAMIRKVSNGEMVEIWGDGEQTRSFIYVKDLVHIALAAIKKKIPGPLNIATRDQVSIINLAKQISKEYNAEDRITLDKTKPVGVRSRLLDVSKMYNIIDFEPLSIHEGLKDTIAWYKTNQ